MAFSITQLNEDTLAEWKADIPYGTDKYQFCYRGDKIYLALLDSDNMTQDAFIPSEWAIYGAGEANIYTTDGNLPEDRTVDLQGKLLSFLNGITRMKEAIFGGTKNQVRINENAIFLAKSRDTESNWAKSSFMLNHYDNEEKTELVSYLADGSRGNFLLFNDDRLLLLRNDQGIVVQAPIARYDAGNREVIDQTGDVLHHRPYYLSWQWKAYNTRFYAGHSSREKTAVFKYWCPMPNRTADFSSDEEIGFGFTETKKNILVSDNPDAVKVNGTYNTRQFEVPISGIYRCNITVCFYRFKMYRADWLGFGISKDLAKMTFRFFDTNIPDGDYQRLDSPFFVTYSASKDVNLTKGDKYWVMLQSLDNGFVQDLDFTLDLIDAF